MKDDCEKSPELDTGTQPATEEQVQLKPSTVKATRSRNHWISRLCSCLLPRQAPRGNSLLPPQSAKHSGLPTLVLDLDETLVHIEETVKGGGDFTINVNNRDLAVSCRPCAAEFLQQVSQLYEVVIFTASLSCYADQVINGLDVKHCIAFRLFRQDCSLMDGLLIKDLQRLGRDLRRVVIVDV